MEGANCLLLLSLISRLASAQEGCDQALTSPTGNFTSPNYPDPYDNGETCTYNITVPTDAGVTLLFTDLQLEYHLNCAYDRVTVFRPSTGETDVFCGEEIPEPIFEMSGTLVVTFTSDLSTNMRGFAAEYVNMPVSCDADGGWVDYAGACYLFPSEMTSAFEAESRCQERGGHLASIHSDQENLFVGRNGEGAPRWIGLQRVDGVWGWSDGSPVDYQNWNENFIFNDTYAIMWIDQWVNDDCSVGRPYICRLHDQVGACPQGWESLSSDCFLLVDAPAAFGTAMEGCRAANPAANLLTFESRDDTNDIVAFVVNSLSGRPVTEYWIGYLRNPSTMAWRWIDGNANQDERWFPGYPEEDASKNCAHLILSSWDDFPPGYTFPFVCKKELAGA